MEEETGAKNDKDQNEAIFNELFGGNEPPDIDSLEKIISPDIDED